MVLDNNSKNIDKLINMTYPYKYKLILKKICQKK